jgi:hypothetical protein
MKENQFQHPSVQLTAPPPSKKVINLTSSDGVAWLARKGYFEEV